MNLSKLLPMMATGGVAYTQQDTIAVMVEAPVEAAQIVRCQMEVASIQRILIIDTLTDEIGRDLEPRFYAVRAARRRNAHRLAQTLHRYGYGAGTHWCGVAGTARQL